MLKANIADSKHAYVIRARFKLGSGTSNVAGIESTEQNMTTGSISLIVQLFHFAVAKNFQVTTKLTLPLKVTNCRRSALHGKVRYVVSNRIVKSSNLSR